MRYKKFYIFLIVIFSSICTYSFLFMLISNDINKKANKYSISSGNVDFYKKQYFLDSIWNKPVYNLFGINYTYEEIVQNELSFGLDLKGGLSIILEISYIDILKFLSKNSKDKYFLYTIKKIKKNKTKESTRSFVYSFYKTYKKINPKINLSKIFLNNTNNSKINFNNINNKNLLLFIEKELNKAIDISFNILKNRINQFGNTQVNIQKIKKTNKIQIEFPGINNPKRIKKILQGVAKLEFWEVFDIKDIGDILLLINNSLLKEKFFFLKKNKIKNKKEISNNKNNIFYLKKYLDFNDKLKTSSLINLLKSFNSSSFTYAVSDKLKIKKIFKKSKIRSIIPFYLKFLWGSKSYFLKNGLEVIDMYPIKKNKNNKPIISGNLIVNSNQDFDDIGRPCVNVKMNRNGSEIWKKITSKNIGKKIAIVLDNYVYSVSEIKSIIPNGKFSISGNFTINEAKDLSNVLLSGSLPASVKIVEEVAIGPTIGKEAQIKGIKSILLALFFVVFFMIFYYALLGLVANIALFFNIFFIFGCLAQLNSSLTLPGLAGILLTIGMSIDANVLIFERIREEIKMGFSEKTAINNGYNKAYRSIIDSNITTFLTGFILYQLGKGPIKGFAITMMIGIATSFFSSTIITRLIIDFIHNKFKNKKLFPYFFYNSNFFNKINFNFIKKRKFSYIFSLFFLTIGFFSFVFKGFNWGIDFTGGKSYIISFYSPVNISNIKNRLSEDLYNLEIKLYGSNNIIKITTGFLEKKNLDFINKKNLQIIINGIEDSTGFKNTSNKLNLKERSFLISGSYYVDSNIANDIKNSSLKSILLSFFIIFLYICIRFNKWQFGLSAIIALLHDILMIFSMFSFINLLGFCFELNQIFIGSLLTIIGYSINDTVVVFDRIREKLLINKEKNIKNLINLFNSAINETMSRTIITSLTTLVVVLILFIFGGEDLKNFSFTLLIGILFGTYSSIFIAVPVSIDLYFYKSIKKNKFF